MNFAVLASGNGSNLQAIIDAKKKGKIKGTLTLVISDKADAKALVRARKAGVKSVLFVNPKDFLSREDYDDELVAILKKEKVGLVVLAGFMRILSPVFIKAFRNKIINIHPALLPAFKGAHAVKDALAYGVKATGVTVHFVDEEVDHGAIIAQGAIEIKPKDTVETLSARIHKIEHVLYPKVIDLFLRGKIKVSGRVVKAK
jgi:phosphoribosylglycinamide formyltransferase-1